MTRPSAAWARRRHESRARRELTKALFLLDCGRHEHAMVFAMLAVSRFAEWLDFDKVERTIKAMTIREPPAADGGETSHDAEPEHEGPP